ncbi:MAG: glutathione S-transferase [Rhodospirillaceae bacterium]|nr:glutathione S-transferase [Rhodospirillaceae bacterium]
MKLKFVYFNFPFWRAELGKIALYFGHVKFETRIVETSEFAAIKRDGVLNDGTVIPFHQLPCLLVDDVPLCQTGAIARFCGKLSGFYPDGQPILAAQTDQFIDIATDITELVSFTGRDKEPEIKISERQELVKDGLARKLSILDKMIGANCDWIVGEKIGLADIAIWRLSGWLSSGSIDGIPKEIIFPFRNILRICRAVDRHPKIMAWVQETYPQEYNRGTFNIQS